MRSTRSVLAQTLGRFALGHGDPVDFEGYVRQRVEANYFAGALLASGGLPPPLTVIRKRTAKPPEENPAPCPSGRSPFEASAAGRTRNPATAHESEESTVRKIVAGLFISLDGVIEDANAWTGPWFNEEVGQGVGSMIAAQDAMLLGRVTYDGFAAYWPQQTGELADTMNGTTKYVVSDTLESADWQNSTLIRRDRAAAEIAEAQAAPWQEHRHDRQRDPGGLAAARGPAGRAPPARLPGRAGFGQAAVRHAGDKLPLRLIDSATFETGVVHLTYAKA